MMSLRWQLPDAPLRASLVTTQVVTLAALAGTGVFARAALSLTPSYPIKAAALFAAMMVLAAGAVRRHHPHAWFGPANQITTFRAGVVALIAALVGEAGTPAVAAGAVAAASITTALDGVDGWFARRTGMASAFGARFDMEIDAFLILVLASLAWQNGKAGAWVLLSGLLRYLFVAAGWVWPWMRRELFHSFRRKLICIVQIAGLILTLVPALVPPASTVLAAVGLAILCYSFLVDTVWLWQQR
jgi:phosphatidylglycerophosphate synthase